MSVQRCTGCRSRLTLEPMCPRCGCDLTLVRRAEVQARQHLVQGVQAWAAGERTRARSLLQASLALAHSPLAERVLQILGRRV